ncbi:hypothetical protein BKA00_006299 [Actinomadura coerulea]|uniref:Uncharacterized protein n=1 Tax=Actinomadura coerulea TaxID=46159 RepID=A0A7X0G6B3_9ACTN|nr:hypothetical protein [Actinomadura coerulea]MBB6399385.1 hypothetical protein [Actinomadura coerulea]
MEVQGVGAAPAGGVVQAAAPTAAMAITAAASVAVTLALTPGAASAHDLHTIRTRRTPPARRRGVQ